jgi:hypothetical protein
MVREPHTGLLPSSVGEKDVGFISIVPERYRDESRGHSKED